MQPEHNFQKSMFGLDDAGHGRSLTVELGGVDTALEQFKASVIPVEFERLNEPWGDPHDAVLDPQAR